MTETCGSSRLGKAYMRIADKRYVEFGVRDDPAYDAPALALSDELAEYRNVTAFDGGVIWCDDGERGT